MQLKHKYIRGGLCFTNEINIQKAICTETPGVFPLTCLSFALIISQPNSNQDTRGRLQLFTGGLQGIQLDVNKTTLFMLRGNWSSFFFSLKKSYLLFTTGSADCFRNVGKLISVMFNFWTGDNKVWRICLSLICLHETGWLALFIKKTTEHNGIMIDLKTVDTWEKSLS